MPIELSKQEKEAIVSRCTDIINYGIENDTMYIAKFGLNCFGTYQIFREKDKALLFTFMVSYHIAYTLDVDYIVINGETYRINSWCRKKIRVDTSKLIDAISRGHAIQQEKEKKQHKTEGIMYEQAKEQKRIRKFNTSMQVLEKISNSL